MEKDLLTITPFTAADQEAACQLIQAGLGGHFGFVDESLNPDVKDIMTHYVAKGAAFVVAHIGDELVGTGALIHEVEGVGRLVRMSVSGAHRRRGIGRALVAHLVAEARRRRYRRLVLETNHAWPDAVGLYQRCGFVEFDRDDVEVHMYMDIA